MYMISKVVRQRRELARELAGDADQDAEDNPKVIETGKTKGVTGEKKLSDTTKHELHMIKALRLNDHEKRALRITWRRLKGSGGHFTTKLMQEVFEAVSKQQSSMKSVFCKAAFVHAIVDNTAHGGLATIGDHARFMDDYVQDCIDYVSGLLRTPPSAPGYIASRHFALEPMGMNAELWEVLGVCMSELIGKQECVRAYPDATKAWNIFIAALTDFFCHGFQVGFI